MCRIKTAIVLVLVVLVGCSSIPKVKNPFVVVKEPVYHPAWPAPYKACPITWESSKETARVSTSFNENIAAAECNADIERLIKNLTLNLCHYRRELNEERCKDLND